MELLEIKLSLLHPNKVLTKIYENNKNFIDNNENLILALLKNANSTHVFKNQFRNSKFQYIQDWFNVQDGEYSIKLYSDVGTHIMILLMEKIIDDL